MPHLRWIVCLFAFTLPGIALGQAPLQQRIDQHIQKQLKDAAARADDAEFLRRVYLDLTGVIPATEESAGISRRQIAGQARQARR